MATALKTQSFDLTERRQSAVTQNKEPKRLSKAGQWRRDNPGGIGVIIDRRAVNR